MKGSGERYRWFIRGYDRAAAVQLCRKGINPLTAVVLVSRGILEPERVREMTSDGAELSDPWMLTDMAKAAARVRLAIERRERVAVYGDYDVDGITASCMVADYLRRGGLRCDIYIPRRQEEGYGLSVAGLESLARQGVTLTVTVDCGVTGTEEAKAAKELGMDLVITDHHECGDTLPEALAVVDPRRSDCLSGDKDLAGVGVAFKLLCAVAGDGSEEDLLRRYADLVALGTVADVMPVLGENRRLIRYGLRSLRQGRRPGLRKLFETLGMDLSRISVTNIGYGIAPRLNAAGRVGDTSAAVNLLLTEDEREADELAGKLNEMNSERQRLEGEMYNDAMMMARDAVPGEPIVLASDKWHQGVAGIVASRLSERFMLPTVIICLKDGIGRGSCRSVPGFDIHGALARCADFLLSYGGHEMAAGLTLREEDVPRLRASLRESFSPPDDDAKRLDIDFEVRKPELLSMQNVEALEELEPYGQCNPQPVLCMRDTEITNFMPLSGGKHTKLWARKGNTVFDCVFFAHDPERLGLRMGMRADLAFTPHINDYRGRRNVQLYLEDIMAARRAY